MASKNIIIRKQISGVLYDLLPQTSFAQVINGDSKTLETVVSELSASIAKCATGADLTALEGRFNTLVKDAPEAYDTLKEISDYISTHKSEYDALLAVSGNKVDKVAGMGLSHNDFTDELKTKLDDLYTKAQLDGKFKTLTDDVAKNTAAITTLNGDSKVVGSVDYKIAQNQTTTNAAIKANTDAIETLNGGADVDGSVDNKVAAAKTALAKDIKTNTDAIAAINNETTGVLAQAKAYTNTEVAKKSLVTASATQPEGMTENGLWLFLQEA